MLSRRATTVDPWPSRRQLKPSSLNLWKKSSRTSRPALQARHRRPRRPGRADRPHRRCAREIRGGQRGPRAAHARSRRQAARAAALSLAAASRLRRRRSRSRHMVSGHGGDSPSSMPAPPGASDRSTAAAGTSSALEPAVARKIWGEPRAALSWGPPVRSRADEVDGGHRVSGEWMMSSGSRHATWIGLMTPVFDRSGAPIPRPRATRRASSWCQPSSVEWIDNWHVIGLNATNSGGFKVSNLFVPARLLLEPGPPSRRASRRATLQVSPQLHVLRLGFSARRPRHCALDAGRLHRARR